MPETTILSHFSTGTVGELTGTTQRQLDYWARTGLLKPSGLQASGSGSRRRYTFADVVAVQAVAALRRGGCPLHKIRAAVRYLRQRLPDLHNTQILSRMTLLTDGRQVFLLSDRQRLMEVITRQFVWSVPLGKLIQEAQRKVDALPAKATHVLLMRGRVYHLDLTYDPETGQYTVQCRELPGAIEQGRNVSEALANGRQVVESVLDYLSKTRKVAAGARHVQIG